MRIIKNLLILVVSGVVILLLISNEREVAIFIWNSFIIPILGWIVNWIQSILQV